MKSVGQPGRAARDEDGFDTVIHAPVRLRLCAALDASDDVEFSGMLEILQISKSALSKHITTLVEAGYVQQRRAVRDTRQRVWLRLTPAGRTAYRDHVAALRAIVRGARENRSSSGNDSTDRKLHL